MTMSKFSIRWSGSTRWMTSSSLIPLNRSCFFRSLIGLGTKAVFGSPPLKWKREKNNNNNQNQSFTKQKKKQKSHQEDEDGELVEQHVHGGGTCVRYFFFLLISCCFVIREIFFFSFCFFASYDACAAATLHITQQQQHWRTPTTHNLVGCYWHITLKYQLPSRGVVVNSRGVKGFGDGREGEERH